MAVSGSKGGQRCRPEAGQAAVIAVLAMTVLMGMSALGIDLGFWYQTQRHDQAVVDAAALAGAQALPDDPAQAVSLALSYADKNGVTLNSAAVNISSAVVANDTIKVAFAKPAPTFFARVFGLTSVNVGANAAARSGVPAAARYVAPIVVPTSNPMLQCTPPPCGGTTTLSLMDLHSSGSGNGSGAFALLNLDPGATGTADAGTLAAWMLNGDNAEMPLGTYYSAPSTNYNSSAFQDALRARVGDEVLFPVYKPPILQSGSNAQFNIIGWVGFHIDAETANGSSGTLVGHFTRYIADGLQASSLSGGSSDFGVSVIALVQ